MRAHKPASAHTSGHTVDLAAVKVWIMASHLDGALWLTAHEDHKVRVFASLGAHASSEMINEDPGEMISEMRSTMSWEFDTVERRPGRGYIRRLGSAV